MPSGPIHRYYERLRKTGRFCEADELETEEQLAEDNLIQIQLMDY